MKPKMSGPVSAVLFDTIVFFSVNVPLPSSMPPPKPPLPLVFAVLKAMVELVIVEVVLPVIL